jgi:hypothetical protein
LSQVAQAVVLESLQMAVVVALVVFSTQLRNQSVHLLRL